MTSPEFMTRYKLIRNRMKDAHFTYVIYFGASEHCQFTVTLLPILRSLRMTHHSERPYNVPRTSRASAVMLTDCSGQHDRTLRQSLLALDCRMRWLSQTKITPRCPGAAVLSPRNALRRICPRAMVSK